MGLEILDQSVEHVIEQNVEAAGQVLEGAVADKAPAKIELDARRRLEDKLEEMRLRRELREYNFDS